MDKRNRSPHYWKVFHSSRIYDRFRTIKLILRLVEALGSPWPTSKRGRPPKFHPKFHALVCVYMAYAGMTYRDMEGEMPLVLQRSMDHSTVGWAMKRIPLEYITTAVKALHLCVNQTLGGGVFIADSTGIETDRYEKTRRVLKMADKREHRKLHVIVKHYPEGGLISITGAGETSGRRNDSPVFREIFDPRVCRDGLFFADKAYDSGANARLCYDNGLVPGIKQRDFDVKPKGYRRRAAGDFDLSLYRRFRGLVEGVFGGMQTRYGNRTRCRLGHTRKVSILLIALAHNIKAYAKAVALVEIVRREERVSRKIYFYLELLDNPGHCIQIQEQS
jgi:hypothetical protein